MAGKRGSQTSANSSPASATKTPAKRASAAPKGPPRKRGRPSKKDLEERAQQQTQEEVSDGAGDNEDKAIAAETNDDGGNKANRSIDDGEKNTFDEAKADEVEVEKASKKDQEKTEAVAHNDISVIEDEENDDRIPSEFLEKGIIYFSFCDKAVIDEPGGDEDVPHSYIILRPLPLGVKLGDGPLEDTGDARLMKVFLTSRADRFLVFVEDPDGRIGDLRKDFQNSEYATQTSGASNDPVATPFACGVYAITSNGRESHLSYQITYPENMGEVQNELGVREKGSFICSVKNPKAPGPADASLGDVAVYPKHLQKRFRNLRWMPLELDLLNIQNTLMLLIGEGQGNLDHAVDETSKDSSDDEMDAPEEVLEQLEEEVNSLSCILWNALEAKLPMHLKDNHRVKHLEEDDPVFADLDVNGKNFSKIQTSWL